MRLNKILVFCLLFFMAGLLTGITSSESVIPVPSGQEKFPPYGPVAVPEINADPAQAKPVAVGPVASGGSTVSPQIGLGQFSAPVDIYFGIYSPAVDPNETFILTSDFNFVPASNGPAPFIAGSLGNINVDLFGNIPVSALPPGTYIFFLGVTPAGTLNTFYLWTTSIALAVTDQANVIPITVNGSLCSANSYPNKPCVSIKICSPGTSNCQIIDDIVLDTGSYGLRIFRQLLTIPLLQESVPSGPIAECVQFAGGFSFWGPVQTADVILGDEPAVSVPIQVIDSTFGALPPPCQDLISDQAQAGHNGILGLGVLAHDCGPVCSNISSNGIYYACSGNACAGASVALPQQVQNPVALLPQDNNGVLIELPQLADSGGGSVSGNLVLGIGTRSNNIPSGVKAFAVDQFATFSTAFNGIVYGSFIDSGSNGIFFPAPSRILPLCPAPNNVWFCPPSELSLSATNISASGSPVDTVFFKVGNFEALLGSGNRVFTNIAGPFPGQFDWGIPFFFGRSVFFGLEGTSSSLGPGPYFAY